MKTVLKDDFSHFYTGSGVVFLYQVELSFDNLEKIKNEYRTDIYWMFGSRGILY